MEGLIDRQKAINKIVFGIDDKAYFGDVDIDWKVIDFLNSLPSVTPKEKTGKWKVQHTNLSHLPSDTIVTCLECGHTKSRIDGEILNFCPKCGARMVSE